MRITNKCRYLKGSVEEDRAALSLSLSLSLPDLDIEGTSFEKMGAAIDATMDVVALVSLVYMPWESISMSTLE